MEVTAAASTTGSQTIADLIAHSAAEHAEQIAVRYKRDGAWHDVTYAQLADIVQEIGLGLIDLGIQPGERFCILANTRPEWSYVDMAATSAGAVVVPIYQTNSPEECLWVISDSGACAVVCEDDEQLAKIAAIRDRLPNLRTVIVIDPPVIDSSSNGSSTGDSPPEAITLEEVRERGRGRSPEELAGASRGRAPGGPVHVHLHLRHDRAAEGLRAHPRQLPRDHRHDQRGRRDPGERGHLPLPAARPLLRPARPARRVRPRRHARVLRRGHQADRPRAAGGQADLPAVGAARVREDLHARPRRDRGAAARGAQARAGGDRAGGEGARHDQPRRTGAGGADGAVRGGRREAVQKRARDLRRERAPRHQRRRADRPGDPRVLLGLRRAGARGLRHDRDRHRRDRLHGREPSLRHRRARASRRAS